MATKWRSLERQVEQWNNNPELQNHVELLAKSMQHVLKRTNAALDEAKKAYEHLIEATMDEAIAYLTEHPLSPEATAALIFVSHQNLKRDDARKGAKAKLANDPVQRAKSEVFELWHEWQAGKARYKSGAAFARHAAELFPVIEDSETVERWATRWRKEAAAEREKPASL